MKIYGIDKRMQARDCLEVMEKRVYSYHSVLVELLISFEHYALVKHGEQSFIVDRKDLEFVAGAPVNSDLRFWEVSPISSDTYFDADMVNTRKVIEYHETPRRNIGARNERNNNAGFTNKSFGRF